MKRTIYEKLKKWKNNPERKPLIIEGARQVGKTYIVNEFGKNEFDKYAYFNFDGNKQLISIFELKADLFRSEHNILENKNYHQNGGNF